MRRFITEEKSNYHSVLWVVFFRVNCTAGVCLDLDGKSGMGRRLREGLPISIKSRSRPGCVFGAGIPGGSPLFFNLVKASQEDSRWKMGSELDVSQGRPARSQCWAREPARRNGGLCK